MQYTIFQLFDEYNRFKKKQDFDIYLKVKFTPFMDTSNVQSVDNWMGELNPE